MVYVALIILLGLLAASHFSNRDLIKTTRDINKLRFDDLTDTQYYASDNARKQEIVLHESIASLNKAIARRDDSYYTKLFKALGGKIFVGETKPNGFVVVADETHIKLEIGDTYKSEGWWPALTASEDACKSFLEAIIPGLIYGIEHNGKRIDTLIVAGTEPAPPYCNTMKTVRTKTKKK